MAGLGKFIAISLVIHILFLSVLLGIKTQAEPVGSSVYEVSIISLPRLGNNNVKRAKMVYSKGVSINRLHVHKEILRGPGKEMTINKGTINIKSPEIKLPKYMTAMAGTTGPGHTLHIPSEKTGLSNGTMGGNDIAMYKLLIRDVIRKRWKVPPEIAVSRNPLKASYMIKISRDGHVLDKKLIMTSGNQPYDLSILMALNSITSLPVPPLRLIAGSDTLEIIMTFTSEEMKN